MQDIRTYIDKLHSDAEDCLKISQTASNEGKQQIFAVLGHTYRKLASEMERIAASHAVLDEAREKHLLGLLGGGGGVSESLEDIARVLEQ